jgi:signal transduction histidine kinase
MDVIEPPVGRGILGVEERDMEWWSTPMQGATTDPGVPSWSRQSAPSWLLLWARTAASGLLLLLFLFGGYELIERSWLSHLPPPTLYRLHLARGICSALILGSWAFLRIRQARRDYDAMLQTSLIALEEAVQLRTRELEQARAFVELLFDALPERLVVRDERGEVVKANRIAREEATLDEERLWELTQVPVPTGSAQRLVLEVARDVTRQRNLEAQLRHQEKMAGLGLLAAGFAHDLGNPLASITSELELLEGESDLGRVQSSLAVLQRHIDRINRTLREMTEFARRRRDEVSDVSVEAAIHDSVQLIRHDPRWKQVQLELRLAPDTPPVRMVEDHLVLVLINLMLNAADAMPSGGTLRITSEKQGAGLSLRIADSGVGMTPEVLRNAMKPLFTTKGAHRGTGLGLSVSSDVVRSVGGSLELKSNPGQGTEVSLWFPGPPSPESTPCPNVS